MRTQLVIDTITLQVNFTSKDDANRAYNDLRWYLEDNGYFYNSKLDEIQFKHKTIATITKSSFGKKDKDGKKRKHTCIIVKIAGIKRYIPYIDVASYNCIIYVASFINSNNLSFKVTQIDIAIDIYTKYKHIVALCTKKNPTTNYHKAIDADQKYGTTTYIEKFRSTVHRKLATLYALLYCKSDKHDLPENITRCEISFQKRYLDRNGLNVGKIYEQIQRYHIMYIPNKKKQTQIKKQYDEYSKNNRSLRASDIKKMKLEQYRIHYDIMPLVTFVSDLFQVRDTTLEYYLKSI